MDNGRRIKSKLLLHRSLASAFDLSGTWVGVTDIKEEGVWTWLDGSIGTESDLVWAEGEPSNAGPNHVNEHCGEIWPYFHDYKLNDDRCSTAKLGLCEQRFVP